MVPIVSSRSTLTVLGPLIKRSGGDTGFSINFAKDNILRSFSYSTVLVSFGQIRKAGRDGGASGAAAGKC